MSDNEKIHITEHIHHHHHYNPVLMVIIAVLFTYIGTQLQSCNWGGGVLKKPPSLTASTLTSWTQGASKELITGTDAAIMKTIFRESYQETAARITAGQISDLADARQTLFQFLQAKIRALNRSSAEETALMNRMQPFAEAVGKKLSEKPPNSLEETRKAFEEIAAGL